MSISTSHDVIIIGSGAAGLTAAINLAQTHKVLVLAKGALDSGSTNWAQGGIAAVLDAGDSFENHVEDTMVAGAGLNNRATVEFVVSGSIKPSRPVLTSVTYTGRCPRYATSDCALIDTSTHLRSPVAKLGNDVRAGITRMAESGTKEPSRASRMPPGSFLPVSGTASR